MTEPAVTIAAYHRSAGSNTPVQRVVIHTTSPGKVPYPLASAKGQARGTAGYFTLKSSGGSAHYITDVAEELHCLPDNVIAQHAPPNRGSIGIEVCGQPFYTRAQWLSAEVWPAVVRAQQRTIELCSRHKVPFQRIGPSELLTGWKGVCGHVDISHAWHQTDHTDPGPNFPWDDFMGLPATVEPGPIIHAEEADMAMLVLDAKGPDDLGADSHWEVTREGNVNNWNGARPLKSLADLGVKPPAAIIGVAPDPSGDGVVMFADDAHKDSRGHWVRSTYKIVVGM